MLFVPYGTKRDYISKGWTETVFKGGVFDSTQGMDNYLSMEDSRGYRGCRTQLPVMMNNTKSITAFQFEVSLPSGISLTQVKLTDRKKSGHTASFSKLPNSNYQVTAISLSSETFSGTEGPLVNLTIDVDKDMREDIYEIYIKNIELSTTEADALNPYFVKSKLTVYNIKQGDTNGDGKVTITDAVAIVNYILGSPPANFVIEAADVNQDGKVSITDAVAIVNKILAAETFVNQREMATPARLTDTLGPE